MKYVLERELDIAILEAQIDADELYDLFMVEFLGSRTQQGKSKQVNNGIQNSAAIGQTGPTQNSPDQAGIAPSPGSPEAALAGNPTGY